ncbi:MAG: hypothetical protein WCP63_07540 [Cyanobium sp. ELA712]
MADKLISSHEFADQVMARRFPGASSVKDVILGYPKLYAEYLALSSVTSFPVVFDALKMMIIPMALFSSGGERSRGWVCHSSYCAPPWCSLLRLRLCSPFFVSNISLRFGLHSLCTLLLAATNSPGRAIAGELRLLSGSAVF